MAWRHATTPVPLSLYRSCIRTPPLAGGDLMGAMLSARSPSCAAGSRASPTSVDRNLPLEAASVLRDQQAALAARLPPGPARGVRLQAIAGDRVSSLSFDTLPLLGDAEQMRRRTRDLGAGRPGPGAEPCARSWPRWSRRSRRRSSPGRRPTAPTPAAPRGLCATHLSAGTPGARCYRPRCVAAGSLPAGADGAGARSGLPGLAQRRRPPAASAPCPWTWTSASRGRRWTAPPSSHHPRAAQAAGRRGG